MSGVQVDEAAILSVIGDSIVTRRTKAGMSQQELAACVGIDRSFLSGIERGKRNPTIVMLARLAVALHATPADLVRQI